jgi:hypothetical protein
MNTEDFKRKLTAIFSADVAGYSRLMGEDEAATVKILASYREVFFMILRRGLIKFVNSSVQTGGGINSLGGYFSSTSFENGNRSVLLLVGKCGFVFYNYFFLVSRI